MRRSTAYRDEADIVLVAAAQRGERDALDALLRRHYGAVVERCRRILSNDADANDAAQNALVAVAKGIGRFDGTSSFTTWLYRVSTNAALDEMRRRNRRPEPRAVGREDVESDRQSPSSNPRLSNPSLADPKSTERLDTVVERALIDKALLKIPIDFRTPVILRDLCGLDYAEIADLLNIPPGTVRSRIARGRAALQPHLSSTIPANANSLEIFPVLNVSLGNPTATDERQTFHDGVS